MTLAPPRPPAPDAADVAADACRRFATHLDLLAHQLGEAALDPDARERLAAALEDVQRSVAKMATTAQLGV